MDRIKVELFCLFKFNLRPRFHQHELNASGYENLNDNQLLETILCHIETNNSYFKIKSNKYSLLEKQPVYAPIFDKIKRKLFSNHLKQFPSENILCKIAFESYYLENNSQGLAEHGWHIYEIFKVKNAKSKINVFLHVNEQKGQFVMSFKGTLAQFEIKQLLECDPVSYTKSMIDIYTSLFFYLKKCLSLSRYLNFNLTFTGYAFSSFLSDLCVFICHNHFNETNVKGVTFESFGTKRCFEELNSICDASRKTDLNSLKIETFFIEKPNFFNSFGEHIGQMFLLKSSVLNNESNKNLINDIGFRLNGLDSLKITNLEKIFERLTVKDNKHVIVEWPVTISKYPTPIVQIDNSRKKYLFKILREKGFQIEPNEIDSFENSLEHLIQYHVYYLCQLFAFVRNENDTNISGKVIIQNKLNNKNTNDLHSKKALGNQPHSSQAQCKPQRSQTTNQDTVINQTQLPYRKQSGLNSKEENKPQSSHGECKPHSSQPAIQEKVISQTQLSYRKPSDLHSNKENKPNPAQFNPMISQAMNSDSQSGTKIIRRTSTNQNFQFKKVSNEEPLQNLHMYLKSLRNRLNAKAKSISERMSQIYSIQRNPSNLTREKINEYNKEMRFWDEFYRLIVPTVISSNDLLENIICYFKNANRQKLSANLQEIQEKIMALNKIVSGFQAAHPDDLKKIDLNSKIQEFNRIFMHIPTLDNEEEFLALRDLKTLQTNLIKLQTQLNQKSEEIDKKKTKLNALMQDPQHISKESLKEEICNLNDLNKVIASFKNSIKDLFGVIEYFQINENKKTLTATMHEKLREINRIAKNFQAITTLNYSQSKINDLKSKINHFKELLTNAK